MRMIVLLLALCAACTPSAQTQAVTVVEATCVAVVSVEMPAAEPLCVLGQEIADAVIAYIAAHAGSSPTITTDATGRTVVPVDLYADLATRPAIKARRVVRCPKLPPPVVAP